MEQECILTVGSAKTVYNWFHNAFPDYKSNPKCTSEDIKLKDELESWLVKQGE